jgi:hypothetical protein
MGIGGWSVAQYKRHAFELELSEGSAEGRLFAILLSEVDLVEGSRTIDGTEDCRLGESGQIVINVANLVAVFDSNLVEGTELDAPTDLP